MKLNFGVDIPKHRLPTRGNSATIVWALNLSEQKAHLCGQTRPLRWLGCTTLQAHQSFQFVFWKIWIWRNVSGVKGCRCIASSPASKSHEYNCENVILKLKWTVRKFVASFGGKCEKKYLFCVTRFWVFRDPWERYPWDLLECCRDPWERPLIAVILSHHG